MVRKRTELNGSGKLTVPPATMLIAIASPSARPIPSTIPVMIPDFAAGTVTLNIVCIFVAPRARDAALICCGTACIDDTLMLITVGRIMIASTMIAASRFDPPVN